MALSAAPFAAYTQFDGADTLDWDLTMVCDCKHICLERSVCLERRAVNGDVDVGGGAEDPVVAGISTVARFGRIRIPGEAQSTAAVLTLTAVVRVEGVGNV